MAYELFVSLRHLKAKRTQKFISVNTWISIGGVALGVMALIVVIAVMSGFTKDLRDKILGTNSHMVVTDVQRPGMKNYGVIVEQVEAFPGVVTAAPFILNQVMVTFGDTVSGILVRGVDAEREGGVSDLEKNLIEGELEFLKSEAAAAASEDMELPARPGVILGKELAKSMNVTLGEVVSMVSPTSQDRSFRLVPKMQLFEVKGVFESGMFEYDSNLAFVSIPAAQRFFSMPDAVTGVEVWVEDIEQAAVMAAAIQKKLGFPYYVKDWMRMNKNLFAMLHQQKNMLFIILVLIILVAAFNIISTLFMVVMEKTKEIAILKSMGATGRSIVKIFSFQGLIIGIVGTALGCIGGFSIVPNLNPIVGGIEKVFGITAFPSNVYFLDKLPDDIQWVDSFWIVVFAIAICFVASLYPAWRASRLNPVDGLRYE